MPGPVDYMPTNEAGLVARVAARYSAVIPFKPRPGVPTELIGGRKYVNDFSTR